jgi:hypothetical protein
MRVFPADPFQAQQGRIADAFQDADTYLLRVFGRSGQNCALRENHEFTIDSPILKRN